MRKILLLFIPVFIYAQSLKSLIEYAHSNNELVSSQQLLQASKQKELDAKESDYYPTVDVGAFYQNLNERTTGLAGDTYSGYAKVGFDIYDGGRKSALVGQKVAEHKASSYDVADTKSGLSLEIMQDFFNIKSLESSLIAREEAQKSLKVQLDRMNAFYDASLATKDDVDRLQAEFDTNIYEMESVKLQTLTLKLDLSLKVGQEITHLSRSTFKESIGDGFESIDSIKSLEYSKKSIQELSESIDSAYNPQIRIEDTYSIYDYGNTDLRHPEGVDAQNKILVSANIRLYDNASISNAKQAIAIQSQSIAKQLEYKTKEQEMFHKLAIKRIEINKVKIKSAESALKSAKSAFHTIDQKYTAGIVDNVVYLDALVAKTNAMSLYETSRNDLQIAYGMYYYYAGKNIEEFINE
ncbi:TolC family protein [Sulfurimonas sp.]|nr:TolC family protein [Sulfurimonas sp.]